MNYKDDDEIAEMRNMEWAAKRRLNTQLYMDPRDPEYPHDEDPDSDE